LEKGYLNILKKKINNNINYIKKFFFFFFIVKKIQAFPENSSIKSNDEFKYHKIESGKGPIMLEWITSSSLVALALEVTLL